MTYYLEISLRPNAEIGIYFLWQKIYQQLHYAMVQNKSIENLSPIGISFPEYDAERYYLGKKIRLFAKERQILEAMNCAERLKYFEDYIYLSSIQSVPEKVNGYACFKRVKLKGSKEKLARRRAKRKGETLLQALSHFNYFKVQLSRLPYINMSSETNGQCFRLYIEKLEMTQSITGGYSCYGLSHLVTVPLF